MRKTAIWLGILLLVALAVAGMSQVYAPASKPIPDELLGVWTTDAPRYAGRTLEITSSTLIFNSSRSSSSPYESARAAVRYSIDRVTTKKSGPQRTLYAIEYMSDGRPGVFSFYSSASPDLAIRFKNQPNMKWTRLGAD